MNKIFAVAKWEFLEKIKTKAFIISVILTPVILLLFAVLPTLLTTHETERTKIVGIVDTSSEYFEKMKEKIEEIKFESGVQAYIVINLYSEEEPFETIKQKADIDVLSNKIEGYILLENAGTDSVKIEYRSKNAGNFRDIGRFEDAFNKIRINKVLESHGIPLQVQKILSDHVNINTIQLKETGEEEKPDFLSLFFSSLIFLMLLFMMIIYSGQMLVRSLLEEKSNRLIEILISSCTSNQLMAGKIFGLASLGLFQVVIWIFIGIGLAGSGLVPLNAFENILPVFIYFVMGFIFYTALFVGIGSIVTTEQEAQQITSYLSLILILPIVFIASAIENPDSVMLQVLTYIPFTLPTTMLLRINLSPLPAEVFIITTLIMIISIFITITLTAKIFRIGVLSYGKRPSFKEIRRWIKEE